MSYREKMTTAPAASQVGGEPNRCEIIHALQTGVKVEWVFSSFEDLGPDWQEVILDGEVLLGSRKTGY